MQLERMKIALIKKGTRGIIGLKRQFKILDDDNSGKIEFNEFEKGLTSFGIEVHPRDVETLFDAFDADKNGSIDFDEFIN